MRHHPLKTTEHSTQMHHPSLMILNKFPSHLTKSLILASKINADNHRFNFFLVISENHWDLRGFDVIEEMVGFVGERVFGHVVERHVGEVVVAEGVLAELGVHVGVF